MFPKRPCHLKPIPHLGPQRKLLSNSEFQLKIKLLLKDQKKDVHTESHRKWEFAPSTGLSHPLSSNAVMSPQRRRWSRVLPNCALPHIVCFCSLTSPPSIFWCQRAFSVLRLSFGDWNLQKTHLLPCVKSKGGWWLGRAGAANQI